MDSFKPPPMLETTPAKLNASTTAPKSTPYTPYFPYNYPPPLAYPPLSFPTLTQPFPVFAPVFMPFTYNPYTYFPHHYPGQPQTSVSKNLSGLKKVEKRTRAAESETRLSLRPTVFEQMAVRKQRWCRYCGVSGSASAEPFKSGPWGKKTLCAHYRGTTKQGSNLILDLSSFENTPDLVRPLVQSYCFKCQKQETQNGCQVIQCDGCPRAYHARCYRPDAPLPSETSLPSEKWFCTAECEDGQAIVVLPNARRLPFMISVAKLAQKTASKTPPDSNEQNSVDKQKDDSEGVKKKFIIKFKAVKIEPFVAREGKDPKMEISVPYFSLIEFGGDIKAENASISMVVDVSHIKTRAGNACIKREEAVDEVFVEDTRDEAYWTRHGKYEQMEMHTRISLLCLDGK